MSEKKVSDLSVLVIGSGGREHALVKAFKESASIQKIFCSPGNAGIAQDAMVINLDLNQKKSVVDFCLNEKIDFVFIGPEDPLVNGLGDQLRNSDIPVVGPSRLASQLEGSKIFAKNFMLQAKVPTADASVVATVEEALAAAHDHTAPFILKADGLAAGKGVFICKTKMELEKYAHDLFEKKILGAAGEKALLEKNLPGYELSFLVLTNGEHFETLPLAQDHKRLADGNLGPNTGGMGTVAPMKISEELKNKIIDRIITPSVQQISKQHKKDKNFLFYGILFVGVMIVNNEPYVLEYNVRFGDPETQVILPLIENDLGKVFYHLSKGQLEPLKFKNKSAFCIVNAAAGYPDKPEKNIPIILPENADDQYVLHAGTKLNDQDQLVSNGGRVLNIIATGASQDEARKKAYHFNEEVVFPGRQFRTDLGKNL